MVGFELRGECRKHGKNREGGRGEGADAVCAVEVSWLFSEAPINNHVITMRVQSDEKNHG